MDRRLQQVRVALRDRLARGPRRQGPGASEDRDRSGELARGQRLQADLRRGLQLLPEDEVEVAEAGVAEEVAPVVLGAECDGLGSG